MDLKSIMRIVWPIIVRLVEAWLGNDSAKALKAMKQLKLKLKTIEDQTSGFKALKAS